MVNILTWWSRLLADTDVDVESSLSPLTKREKKELELLKLLIEVLDTDLKPLLELRCDIKDRVLTHIAFQDLWHLFDIGQEIMTCDLHPQVYRIMRWTGGRPDFLSRAPDLSSTRSEPRSSNFMYVTPTLHCVLRADCADSTVCTTTSMELFTPLLRKHLRSESMMVNEPY